MDRFSKEERSKLMSKVRVTGTDIEKHLLQCVKPLCTKERYRRNLQTLTGKPDIVFPRSKVAVFADGDFWHGKDFSKWRRRVPPFWQKKIASNIKRDAAQIKALKKLGYKVLRFWGSEIKKNPQKCVARIRRYIDN